MTDEDKSSGVPQAHLRISRVVGENEEGMTLFVPKSEQGVFTLEVEEGQPPPRFLTMLFVRGVEDQPGAVETWLPWS